MDGHGFSNAIAFFMILATAATPHADGKLEIESTSGPWSVWMANR